MKIAGIVLLVAGLLMTLWTGFTYVTREKVVTLGDLEITREKDHNVNWQPYFGIGLMVIGGTVLLLDKKKVVIALKS